MFRPPSLGEVGKENFAETSSTLRRDFVDKFFAMGP